MIRKSRVLIAALMMTLSGSVFALALGDVKVNSALNEPLNASVELSGLQSGDTDNMQVGLGTREQFERAGIDRPFLLSLLRFKVIALGDELGRIEVTTKRAVVEPFLNFLIEIDWPRGRVIREYTILLDPPVYGAAISATVHSAATAAPPLASAATRGAAKSAAMAPPSATPATTSSVTGDSYGPVIATDTLWSLAERLRPDSGISVQRMMLALLAANPDAFTVHNVNALRAGAVLRIPNREELGADDKAAALAEVKRQYAQWQELRAQVTGSPGAPLEGRAASSTGSSSTQTSAATGAATGGRVEVLSAGAAKTGVGAAPGEQADVEGLRNELNTAIEDADARQRENTDLTAKLTEAEQIIGDMKRLVQLKDDNIAALQEKLGEQSASGAQAAAAVAGEGETEQPPVAEMPGTTVPAAEPAATEQPGAESAAETPAIQQPAVGEASVTQPTEEATKPAPAPQPPAPSFLDELLSNLPVGPPVLAALGLLLLVGGGAGVVIRRRRRAAEVAVVGAAAVPAVATGESMIEKYAEAETDEDATVLAIPDEGNEDQTEVPAAPVSPVSVEVAESDEDPLAEVNVYLAYERFDQAEELVRGAIAEYPDRNEYRLKLLEIFHASKNPEKFEPGAADLRDAVGEADPMMAQALGWWQELSPDRALFAEAGADAVDAEDDIFDITQAGDTAEDAGDGTMDITMAEGGATVVDFDLGFESTDEATSMDSALDFDIGSGGAESGSDAQPESDESTSGADSGLDFDLGEASPGGSDGEASAADADIGFDLTGLEDVGETPEASIADQEPSVVKAVNEEEAGGLDFDLDVGGESTPVKTAAEESGLDFDLGAPDEVPAGGEESGLDFDLGTSGEDQTELPSATASDDLGLDIDLGSEAGAAPDEAPGEESGLDFDLGTPGEDQTELPSATASDDLGLDIDLGSETGTTSDEAPAEESSLDFDLGAPGEDQTELPSATVSDDLGIDLDLDSEAEAPVAGTPVDESGPDLDLGTPSEDQTEMPSVAASEDLGIDLGLDSEAEAPVDESGLDFDLGTSGEDQTEMPSATASDDLGIDLGLDSGAEVSVAEAPVDESGLDFDLGTSGEDQTEMPSATASDDSGIDLGLDSGAEAPVVEAPVEESGLDFDLDAPGEDQPEMPSVAASEDLGLDIDLGSEAGAAPDEAAAAEGDLNLDPGASGDDHAEVPSATASEALGLDIDLDSGVDAAEGTASIEASGLDFDPGAPGGDQTEVLNAAAGEDPGVDFDLTGLDDQPSVDGGNVGSIEDSAVDFDLSGFDADQDQAEAAADEVDSLATVRLNASDLAGEAPEEEEDLETTQFMLKDAVDSTISAAGSSEAESTVLLDDGLSGQVNEIQTKLDLAQAYIDMDDREGARAVLDEVVAQGDDAQREQARQLLAKLS